MLPTRTRATGDYSIRHFIYVDAYCSETVAYADLVLPDTTYLERWDCISLLDRPIGRARRPSATPSASRVVEPDRNVRPFQDVLIDLGVRLELPALAKDGEPQLPGGYPDYVVHHERRARHRPARRLTVAGRATSCAGAPDLSASSSIHRRRLLPLDHLPERNALPPSVNRDYLDWALDRASAYADAGHPPALRETLQRFRLAAEAHGQVPPPDAARARPTHFDPLPFWYPPFEQPPSPKPISPACDHPAADADVP